MFENIIGQDKTISILRRELQSRSLPGSILIHGEPYSAKLSTALEIARVLTCASDGAWSCDCSACKAQRLLTHPGTLLLGTRAFLTEISASADVLRRVGSVPARYLYVRSQRKLLRRCDPGLWEGGDTRLRGVFDTAAEIEEILADIEPGGRMAAGVDLEPLLARASDLAARVARALPRDNTPIGVLRNTAFWAHLSSSGPARIVIIENADRMVEASRNSLLKLLEEPPAGVYLMLLTTNPQAVIATVLSRLRRYRLEPRTAETAREVLSRVFRDDTGKHTSLSGFFRSWEGVSDEKNADLAALFLEAVSSPELDERPLLALYDKSQRESVVDAGAFFREFSRALAERIREEWKQGRLDAARLGQCNRILQATAAEQATLNLQPFLAMQSTLYRLREAVA